MWWLVYGLDHRGIVVWFLGTVTKFPFSGASRPFLGLTQPYCSVGTGVSLLGAWPGLLPSSSVETENEWSHASTFLRFNGVHRDDITGKGTFSIVLKTHTPHYLRTTFQKILLSSLGENMVFLDKIVTYILNESFLHLWDSSIHILNIK